MMRRRKRIRSHCRLDSLKGSQAREAFMTLSATRNLANSSSRLGARVFHVKRNVDGESRGKGRGVLAAIGARSGPAAIGARSGPATRTKQLATTGDPR
jgi:hypothetical protein